jgi:hypothetical protein
MTRKAGSNANSFHIILRDLVVFGYGLRLFNRPAIFEISGDPGGAKSVLV